MDDMSAFLLIDPVFAGLNKHYLDAKAIRRQSEKEYGAGDVMTSIAADMEDSAWCALQTRYMELRGDAAMSAAAKEKMAEADECERRKKELEKEEDGRRLAERLQVLAIIEKRKQKDMLFFLILIHAGMSGHWGLFRYEMPSYSFNRLAA